MSIIVTGGAGNFIGSNFVFHMLNKYPDYRIICLDKMPYTGNMDNMFTVAPVMENPNFRFAKADICDCETVFQLFEEKHHNMLLTLQHNPILIVLLKTTARLSTYLFTTVGSVRSTMSKGYDMRYALAIGPINLRNELGWLLETMFEDSIKKTIQWYLDNRDDGRVLSLTSIRITRRRCTVTAKEKLR